jgi:hypothetical protein
MCFDLNGFWQNNPFRRKPPWNVPTSYFIVRATINLIWLLRIFSPGVWWAAVFSYRGHTGRYYGRPGAMEFYLIAIFLIGFLLVATGPHWTYTRGILILSGVVIIEIFQYHFYHMAIRPHVEQGYLQYSSIRTIILTLMAFINVVNYFALVYFYGLRLDFQPALNLWSAWAYSAGDITSAGYSGVTPKDTAILSIVTGSEKMFGVLFLAIVVSLALSRTSVRVEEIGDDLDKHRWKDRL